MSNSDVLWRWPEDPRASVVVRPVEPSPGIILELFPCDPGWLESAPANAVYAVLVFCRLWGHEQQGTPDRFHECRLFWHRRPAMRYAEEKNQLPDTWASVALVAVH